MKGAEEQMTLEEAFKEDEIVAEGIKSMRSWLGWYAPDIVLVFIR